MRAHDAWQIIIILNWHQSMNRREHGYRGGISTYGVMFNVYDVCMCTLLLHVLSSPQNLLAHAMHHQHY